MSKVSYGKALMVGNSSFQELGFLLNIDDGWPPVAVEWLWVTIIEQEVKIETAPLFIKDLSVHDIIKIRMSEGEDNIMVGSWSHIFRSKRSTVWVMAHGEYSPELVLQRLRSLGCNTESLESFGMYAIDVPADLTFSEVDKLLACLDKNLSSVVFPSFRHSEPIT